MNSSGVATSLTSLDVNATVFESSPSASISYNEQMFAPVGNSATTRSAQHSPHYRQQGELVRGRCSGGDVQFGMLIAVVEGDELGMRYNQTSK